MYTAHAFPGVTPGEQYDANANKNLLVVVQLESRSGVENVEKIAAVDGIDVSSLVSFHVALFLCRPASALPRVLVGWVGTVEGKIDLTSDACRLLTHFHEYF